MTTAGSLALEGNVARECFGQHEGTDAVIENAIRQLKDLGAEIVDPVRASRLPFFGELELELFRYGLKTSLNRYLGEHPRAKVRNLEDLIRFNQDHATRVMPYFRQEFLEEALAKGDLTDETYFKVKAELCRLGRTDGIDKALSEHQLDAIIAPTEGSPAFVIDPVVGDNILRGGCSTPPAVAGYPHISLPAGYWKPAKNTPTLTWRRDNAYCKPLISQTTASRRPRNLLICFRSCLSKSHSGREPFVCLMNKIRFWFALLTQSNLIS